MLWDTFVNKIAKPIGSSIARGATMAGDYFANIVSPASAITASVAKPAVEIGVSKQLSAAGLTEKAQQGIKENLAYDFQTSAQSNDLLLKAAVELNNKVISPVITRPISTYGLLTDYNSPLYAKGKYEQGFQLADIRRAYNRSEKVSAFVALTQSDLAPVVKNVSNVILDAGGVDVANIDLWDDQNVQKNFSDNIVGRFYTGTGDFVVSNLAISGAGSLVARAGKTALKSAGLSTKGKTLQQFESDINDGILHNVSGGQQGKLTNSAQEIIQVAQTDDINLINNFVSKYSNNERLAGLIADTKDPAIVRDYILADKGYLPALERLSKTNPSELAELGDLPGYIRARNLLNDDVYQPTGDALPRMRSAFEDAIKKNPEHQKIYDAFLDPEGNVLSLGKTDVFPIEPKFATSKISKTITGVRELKAAAVTRDFSNIGWIEERLVGSKSRGLITSLVRFAGTYKPMGFVTFSGARPLDGVVELNAAFDDIRLFKDGANLIKVSSTQSVTAAEYRNRFIREFVSAPNASARRKVLETLDERLAHDIARSYDFYDRATINNLQTVVRERIAKNVSHMGQNGFGIDANGRALMVDAQTQSQLVESYRMAPWSQLERELIRAKKNVEAGRIAATGDALNNVYEALTKYWTFDVLARPSYIVKQSWLEPVLSAGLSQGAKYVFDEVPSMTRNGLKNWNNRFNQIIRTTLDSRKATEVNNVVKNISSRLEQAVQQYDDLAAESYRFFETDVMSPKTRKDYGDIVKAELKRAEKAVEDLEIELQAAAKPFGMKEEIPSLASLERRIRFIESSTDSGFKSKNAAAIANAKSQIVKAKGELNTLLPDAKALTKIYDDMAKVYDEIDNVILKDLGKAELERAKFFGRSAEYKKRYYGKDAEYTFLGDQYVKIDSLFDENQLGAALREEFANARTTSLTYAGELTTGTRNSILLRRGPRTVTDINDPLYFEELAYVANRTFRGKDPLVRMALQDMPIERIQEWALTKPGIKYFQQFGDFTEGQIPTLVRNRVGLVRRYLPSKEARALVLEREVTSLDLAQILADEPGRLSALHPLDFDYDMAIESSRRGIAGVEEKVDKAMGTIWSKLTSPENPIRWSFADKVFKDIVAKKATNLANQGVELTVERLNALRASATREALQETEKTFYTVRRKNRALWAARVFTAFPTASLNAMYRYGRFAIKNPVRSAAFMYNYQAAFRSFGVDRFGNPTDDPTKATHLLLPGTKELGLFGGKGVRLNARSIGFLINLPSPSYISSVPIGMVLKNKPEYEEVIKSALGPTYDYIFPYGPQTNWASPLVPAWARDAYKWATGPEGDKNFINSVKSVANYYHTLEEMGIAKFPGYDKVYADARGLYLQRALWLFASPFGVPVKTDTSPMKIFQDYYNILMNKNLSKGLNRSDAMDAAEAEFLAVMGPNFPIDRLTFKGSTAFTYVPATAEGYKRVWKDNTGLIESLGKLGENNQLIGLLTLDIDANKESTNLSIYNFLNDPKTKLPDGSSLNRFALTPKQEERARKINRTWEKYIDLRDRLDAAAQERYGKPLRRIPELSKALSDYADTVLKQENPDWWKEKKGQLAGGQDNSFNYARALYEIVNNEKFMKQYGSSPVWQDAKKFVDIRNAITMTYQALPSGGGRKTALKEAYLDYLSSSLGTFHPKIQEIIKRYFDDDTMKVVTD